MKKIIWISVLAIMACDKKLPAESSHEKKVTDSVSGLQRQPLPENLVRWMDFYRAENPDFNFSGFTLKDSLQMMVRAGNVPAVYEEDFEEVYKKFLIYSADSLKYVDFHSYHWSLDENQNPSFEADQQVNLVDMEKKEISQIAFFGPSFTIEEGYWEDNSTIVLLGNTYEKVPFYMKFDLEEKIQKIYQYPDTLAVSGNYTEMRLKQHGIGGN